MGLVLAGAGLELGAVEGHPAESHQAGLLAQDEDLEEEPREGGQVATAELADGLVVGPRLPGEDHEADVRAEALLDAPRTGDPGGVAVEQDLEHQRGVVRRHAPGLVVGGQEGRQVELGHEHIDEGCQAVGLDPVAHRRRHQQEGVLVIRAEGLGAHG